MAKAAVKKQVQANLAAIKNLHTISVIVNAVYVLSYVILRRPKSIWSFMILSLPAWIIEYQLDRIGRPRYSLHDGSLVSGGEDLNQAGLTEYLWDIVYVTWACDVLVVLFGRTWLWIFYLSIPVYAVVTGYLSFVKPMLAQRAMNEQQQEGVVDVKSKTSAKKQKQKVKYVR
ncbi:hypothetical protein V1512DRAFT_265275 [Lipomyces arxii]|uniref:uncharacterized protein n=1 Tax=Lipomyces arxii TaxID=56418 RepID=UPI0034CF8256